MPEGDILISIPISPSISPIGLRAYDVWIEPEIGNVNSS